MITFRPAKHSLKEEDCIELWRDGVLLGMIYFHDDHIRILSKYPHRSANMKGADVRVIWE